MKDTPPPGGETKKKWVQNIIQVARLTLAECATAPSAGVADPEHGRETKRPCENAATDLSDSNCANKRIQWPLEHAPKANEANESAQGETNLRNTYATNHPITCHELRHPDKITLLRGPRQQTKPISVSVPKRRNRDAQVGGSTSNECHPGGTPLLSQWPL